VRHKLLRAARRQASLRLLRSVQSRAS
jgi:hypothetical protein